MWPLFVSLLSSPLECSATSHSLCLFLLHSAAHHSFTDYWSRNWIKNYRSLAPVCLRRLSWHNWPLHVCTQSITFSISITKCWLLLYNECIVSHWNMKSKRFSACRVKACSIPHHAHREIQLQLPFIFLIFKALFKGTAQVYIRHVMKKWEHPIDQPIYQSNSTAMNNSPIRIKDCDKLWCPKWTWTDYDSQYLQREEKFSQWV